MSLAKMLDTHKKLLSSAGGLFQKTIVVQDNENENIIIMSSLTLSDKSSNDTGKSPIVTRTGAEEVGAAAVGASACVGGLHEEDRDMMYAPPKWGVQHDLFLQAMKQDGLLRGRNDKEVRPFHSFGLTAANINAFHDSKEGHCNLLFHTIKEGNYSVYKYLLQMGADPVLPNKHLTNALHLIIRKNLPWIGHLNIDHMPKDRRIAFVNCGEAAGGNTPLMSAARSGDLVTCHHLVNIYGADVNKQMSTGWTALHTAAKSGHLDIVRFLIKAGADPSVCATHRQFGKRVRPWEVTERSDIVRAILTVKQ